MSERMKKDSTKVSADQIAKSLSKKHYEDFFITQVKSGSTWMSPELSIIDAMAIKKSWTKPDIVAYEIKVNRQDFLNDDKYAAYLDYCHRFYFACPSHLIEKEELKNDRVGLIWYKPETGGLYTRKKSIYNPMPLFEDKISMLLYYILMSRVESDRHPFFSSDREFIEAFMQDKIERDLLGYRFNSKVMKEIKELDNENNRLKRGYEKNKEQLEELGRIKEILNEHGISRYGDIEGPLKEHLKAKVSPKAERLVQGLVREINSLSKMMLSDEENE